MKNKAKSFLISSKYDGLSQEMASLLAYTQNAVIMGILIGGSIHSKNQYMDFMENATASQYKWHLDAKADLTNKMLKGGFRGAYIWGVKSFIISATFA